MPSISSIANRRGGLDKMGACPEAARLSMIAGLKGLRPCDPIDAWLLVENGFCMMTKAVMRRTIPAAPNIVIKGVVMVALVHQGTAVTLCSAASIADEAKATGGFIASALITWNPNVTAGSVSSLRLTTARS